MKILDVCCGSKMFYFQKNYPDVVFMDIREIETTLCDGRKLKIEPDVVGDFRCIPFPDNEFDLVIFDPPHLKRAGKNSYMRLKYGVLGTSWKEDIKKGFNECFRVLKDTGTLIFKWNEDQIKLAEILQLTDKKPLLGNQRSKTHWLIFVQGGS